MLLLRGKSFFYMGWKAQRTLDTFRVLRKRHWRVALVCIGRIFGAAAARKTSARALTIPASRATLESFCRSLKGANLARCSWLVFPWEAT